MQQRFPVLANDARFHGSEGNGAGISVEVLSLSGCELLVMLVEDVGRFLGKNNSESLQYACGQTDRNGYEHPQ